MINSEIVKNAFDKNIKFENGELNIKMRELVLQVNDILKERDPSQFIIENGIVLMDNNYNKYIFIQKHYSATDNIIGDPFQFLTQTNIHPIEEDVAFNIDGMIEDNALPEGYDALSIQSLIHPVAERVADEYEYSGYNEYIINTINEVAKEQLPLQEER